VTLVAMTVTIGLGFWQMDRANSKQALQMQIDTFARQPPQRIGAEPVANPDELWFHPVELTGEFAPQHTIFVDNQVYEKQQGFHVYTPFRIESSQKYVLVKRGWIGKNLDTQKPEKLLYPTGELTIVGMAQAPSTRFIELSDEVIKGEVWQNISLERFGKYTHLQLEPFVLQQTSDTHDGLARQWPKANVKRTMNLSYALQWFVMAGAIFIYFLVTNVRRID
jgi:surfeit locus 1 family protein